ncbi:MAG: hypothetical protein O7G84_01150 [Gammaproteobacteria bacterium]|nr:hypothetical protein [Gammaproteobacteria bacterium]
MQVYSVAELVKARKLDRRRKFQGLDISVETQRGAYRHWHDPHTGRDGKTKMPWDYGYIRGSVGADGDHVDAYIGPDPNATHAYVVDQMRAPDFQIFDEQKVFLGFESAQDARAAYASCYDKPGFFGRLKAVPMGEFRRQVLNTSKDAPLIKAGGDTSLVHEIFEDATPGYPVVTHVFTGKDRAEVQGYFDAHMKTDAFMRGMENAGEWNGVKGRAVKRWSAAGMGLRKAARKRLGLRLDLPRL